MKYKLHEGLMARYSEYLNSETMKDIPEYSKSEYWELHASEVKISIKLDTVEAKGKSGFYAPSKRSLFFTIKKLVLFIANPLELILRVKRVIGIPVNGIKHLSYFTAFNKTMTSDVISQPQLSSSRINYSSLVKNEFIYKSVKECQEDYDKVSNGKKFSDHILIAYYYLNIFNAYTNLQSVPKSVILEIGGGNGNLSSVIKWHSKQSTVIDVDLPETISHAILYIADLFPEAKILMPHEAQSGGDFSSYDFVFLTPPQIHLIEDESIDLSINCHSFQEMTHTQINEYFEHIQRVSKNNAYFFTANRTEKIPSGEGSFEKETKVPPNRFSEFPWQSPNEILIHEICRLFRLVQLDSIFNRLEKIKK
jgi:putative sugar O-methyltransferase